MKVIDMHCDTISELMYDLQKGKNYDLDSNPFHISLNKMEQAEYILQNFAMFVDKSKHPDVLEHCLEMIDCFYNQMDKFKDRIGVVLSYKDIEDNINSGKLSALLTVEEGAATGLKLSHLRNLYRLGVRMMTLTWNYENGIGYPNLRKENLPNMTDGLTPFGIELIQEMEDLHMIIDVSHLSDKGFYDVLNYTNTPFTASHSNARALCHNMRNLSDDMIKQLASRGGVIGINFFSSFLKRDMTPDEELLSLVYIAEHMEHIIKIGGYECVGLGSDFDGIPTNKGIPDCSYLPRLYDVLKRRGWKECAIEACFYKNVLRLYKEVLR